MKKLLLIPLKLGDLFLFPFVICLELLHQLLVRLDESRVLDERSDLVVLLALSLTQWLLRLLSVVQVVSEGRVEVHSSRELLLEVGN